MNNALLFWVMLPSYQQRGIPMLAFLINPTTETIEVVEHDGDYKNIQKLIKASLFTTVCIKYDEDKGVSTDIYVDDETV